MFESRLDRWEMFKTFYIGCTVIYIGHKHKSEDAWGCLVKINIQKLYVIIKSLTVLDKLLLKIN